MTECYRHRQIGWVILGSLGGGMILIAVTLLADEFNWVGVAVLALLAFCMVVFPTLTVTVDDRTVRAAFGPGLIRRTIALSDVQACEVVRNPWWYGWGVRLIPGGWMFNASGLRAVELQLKSGKIFRIGTDQPDQLAAAVRQGIQETA